jgi:hypothetical protein
MAPMLPAGNVQANGQGGAEEVDLYEGFEGTLALFQQTRIEFTRYVLLHW